MQYGYLFSLNALKGIVPNMHYKPSFLFSPITEISSLNLEGVYVPVGHC